MTLPVCRDEANLMIRCGPRIDTSLMAPTQSLDWRRVAVFTPLMASVSIFLVYARDLQHGYVLIVAVLLFAVPPPLWEIFPMRELNLPVAVRRNASLTVLAGLVAYVWSVRTKFFHETPPLNLFLIIFAVTELTLILITRSAVNAAQD
jgi:hypothetical protein